MIIDCGGVEVFACQEGHGEPLLLIHGLGMSSRLWEKQFPAFSPHFRTVAADLRGFGQSSRPRHAGAYDIEVLASDMAVVMRHLEMDCCHVLGTSMGGFVAQALALAEPERCRSLILCHTAPQMEIPQEVLEQRIEALGTLSMREYGALVAEQALAPGTDHALVGWLIDMVAQNDKEAYLQVLTEGLRDFNVREQLHRIAVPTLIIAGQHDRVLPPSGARQLAGLIANAQLVEIGGVGHIGYAEKPSEFNHAVLNFLLSLA